MEHLRHYNCVIWDWDGTLGMTLDEWVNGYAETFEEHGLTATRGELINSMGSFRRQLNEHWGQSTEMADSLVTLTHQRVAPRLERVKLYPGAEETIRTLGHHGLSQAIATKSHRAIVEQAARHNGIHHIFKAFVGGNELSESEQKPHRKSVDLIHQRLGSRAIAHTILIGDSTTDLITARNAEIDSILFYPPENEAFYTLADLKREGPTHIARSFAEIEDILLSK